MPKQRQRFWVGHCIIRPDQRGLGLGKQMMLLILDEAFCNRKAKQVSLVVFPENVVAIRCYERVGFVEIGEQIKFFHTSGQEHRMLQMAIDRTKYKTMPASVEPR